MNRVLVLALLRRAKRDVEKLQHPNRGMFLTGLPNFRRFFVRDLLWFIMQLMSLPKDSPSRERWMPTVPKALAFIAENQSTYRPSSSRNPFRIIHDWYLRTMREEEFGQMPHEIPRDQKDWLWLKFRWLFFRGHPYYGSIDSTPLWIIAVAEYVRQTDDIDFAIRMQRPLERAGVWIVEKINEGDGLVRYRNKNRWNLAQHSHYGWKDGMLVGDGLATIGIKEPIALVEVQGYTYRALTELVHLASYAKAMRDDVVINKVHIRYLRISAMKLRRKILNKFWLIDKQFFALALDGDDEQVPIITSNAMHLLWCGVVEVDDMHGRRMLKALTSEHHLWTDFGIRTHDASDKYFDAESYHLGSVWPFEQWILYEALRGTYYGAVLKRVRRTGLYGLALVGGNDEVYTVSKDGELSRMEKSATPQLWTVGAALALCEWELRDHSGG